MVLVLAVLTGCVSRPTLETFQIDDAPCYDRSVQSQTSVVDTHVHFRPFGGPKGRWCYLYRAIDSRGATIDFVLSALRDAAAARRLFRKALTDPSHPQPRVMNTDQARLYGAAIPAVKTEGTLRRHCRHRPVRYVNNILEQDHRAIKRRVKAKQGFREFHAARRTIEG